MNSASARAPSKPSSTRFRRPTSSSMRCSASACRARPKARAKTLIEAINAQPRAVPVDRRAERHRRRHRRDARRGRRRHAHARIHRAQARACTRAPAITVRGRLELAELQMPSQMFEGIDPHSALLLPEALKRRVAPAQSRCAQGRFRARAVPGRRPRQRRRDHVVRGSCVAQRAQGSSMSPRARNTSVRCSRAGPKRWCARSNAAKTSRCNSNARMSSPPAPGWGRACGGACCSAPRSVRASRSCSMPMR